MFVTNLEKDFYDVIQRNVSRRLVLPRGDVLCSLYLGYNLLALSRFSSFHNFLDFFHNVPSTRQSHHFFILFFFLK